MPQNAFTRKMGPLPVWAWGILGGIAVYFLYTRYKNSSANSAANSPVATTLDPSQVDPATGLTYGQELAGSFPASGGLQGAADSGITGSTGGSPSLADQFNGLDTQLLAFTGALQDFGALAGQLGYTPPNASQATADAAASPPLDNTAPVAASGPGPAARPSVGSPAGPRGAIIAPYGPHKPPAKAGYTIHGTGAGGWIYVPKPHTHKQKTVHVPNPASHQQPVSHRDSTASPVPVRHPAGGGNPGHVQSGGHQRATGGHRPRPTGIGTTSVSGGASVTRNPSHPPAHHHHHHKKR